MRELPQAESTALNPVARQAGYLVARPKPQANRNRPRPRPRPRLRRRGRRRGR